MNFNTGSTNGRYEIEYLCIQTLLILFPSNTFCLIFLQRYLKLIPGVLWEKWARLRDENEAKICVRKSV